MELAFGSSVRMFVVLGLVSERLGATHHDTLAHCVLDMWLGFRCISSVFATHGQAAGVRVPGQPLLCLVEGSADADQGPLQHPGAAQVDPGAARLMGWVGVEITDADACCVCTPICLHGLIGAAACNFLARYSVCACDT